MKHLETLATVSNWRRGGVGCRAKGSLAVSPAKRLSYVILAFATFVPVLAGAGPSDATTAHQVQPGPVDGAAAAARPRDAALPPCGQSESPLSAAPFGFHEDSTIQTRIDLSALDVSQYASLGVQVAREDGIDYRPIGPSFSVGAQLRALPPDGCFDRAFSQLNPGRVYDVCLIGQNADFTSTGLFACVSVATAPKKPETALLITSSDSGSIRRAIDDWTREVRARNPDLDLQRANLAPRMSVRRLWDVIRKQYLVSNLTTVILGSPGLPLPLVDNFGAQVPYTGVYTSLSRNFMADDGFLNPANPLGEVSIAAWNAPPATIANYLRRVIAFYRGSIQYEGRLLVGNAMVPSESALLEEDFIGGRYPSGATDYVGGITQYSDDGQGTAWSERYLALLASRSFELVLLNAHGTPSFHNPCTSAGCVDAAAIRDASPSAQFVVAVSCSIGNLGALSTPMTAYVFESRSLGGLASELTFFSNGSELLHLKSRLSEGVPIGQAGRRFGLTAFGDPFLRLR
jgi:hypothetical protein